MNREALYSLCSRHYAYISREVGVWVDGGAGHVELLGEVFDLLDEGHDGLELLVGLAERGLELSVGVDQALDLVEGVHDEHVHQVLAGPVQPVVERLQKVGILVKFE